MVARFLNYYAQYRLSDLREMEVGEFLFLLVGMLDNVAPGATEPIEDRISRLAREAHLRGTEQSLRMFGRR